MAKIVVMADVADGASSAVVLSERVAPELFDSGHYATQLIERARWAVQDAIELEHARGVDPPRSAGDGGAAGGRR